jgi:hypothetical protein
MVKNVFTLSLKRVFFILNFARDSGLLLSTLSSPALLSQERREFYSFTRVARGSRSSVRALGEVRHIFLCPSSQRDFEFDEWFGAD